MSKKIIAVCMGVLLCLVAIPAQKASAADATTIYIGLVSNTAEILKTNSTVSGATAPSPRSYIQGRVLLLDENGKLATTFAGAPIADATLELQSLNAGSDFQYATDAVPTTPSFTAAGGEKVSINLDGAYQEFAVRYDNGEAPLVDFTGAETLQFTLKKGTTSLPPQTAAITIRAPEANCYVVRTGTISDLPDVLEEISSTGKANDGATLEAGASVTVHVFAAKYIPTSGKYYFTDNVPANGKMVLVQAVKPRTGFVTTTNAERLYNTGIVSQFVVTIAQAMVSLTNGYASSSVPVSNLKLPDVLRMDAKSTSADDMDEYLNGSSYQLYWFPFPLGTRLVGDQLNDVATSDDIIQISTGNSGIGLSAAAPSLLDTSKHKPGACKKINIVGLPVNTIKENAAAGYTSITKPGFYNMSSDNKFEVGALDAYYLLNATKKDWTTKPSSFKVGGRSGNHVFGAIVGSDAYGNPASFSTSGTATFALKRTGDVAVAGPQLIVPAGANVWTSDRYPDSNGKIIAAKADQAFLPFAMTATFGGGAVSATVLTDLYIDYANSANISSKAVEDVDSSSEGVSFYMQNYIGAITATYNPSQVGESITMQAIGQTADAEKAFDMKGIVRKTAGYTQLQLGKKNTTSAQTEYQLANKSDNLAQDDIAIFTKSATTQPVFIGYTGQTNGTIVVRCMTATTYFEAADPGDIDLSSITNYIGYASVALDDENHDTMYLTNTFMVKDGYGNVYGSFEEADVQAFAYTVDANGNATTTPFPGADTDVNTIATNFNAVEIGFDLDKIIANNSKAAVVLKSDSGAVASQPTIIDLKSLSSLQAKSYYVPVEGISNHPYIFYFADQNGAMVKPVTVTASNGNTGVGQQVDVDIEADDNGTTTASATETITTKNEYLIKTARLNTGKKSMSIDFESDFGDATLVINPSAADLEKPVIGTPTAIDCGFEVTITDDKGVDAAATQVTVRNASGDDITSTVAKTVASDNGTKAVIQVKGTGAGAFSVDVVAQDDAGNKQTATGLIVSVTTANDCAITAECLEVDPAFVKYGDPETVVTITGKNTNFVQGTTTVDFSCDAVTEGAVDVESATSLTVRVSVPASGADQNCDITVTTGSESITCANKFQVLSQPPVTCVDNDNDTYGENCPAGTDCDDTNPAVNPGATEVCGDNIDNNCDGQTDEGCVAPCTISVSGTIKAGFILPRVFVITVTGTGDDFSTSSPVTLSGTGVRKLGQIPSGTGIRVIGIVRPKAKGTTVNVSVAGCGDADVTVQ